MRFANIRHCSSWTGVFGMWVVVKIMVPFWVPGIVRHLIFRVPKKEPHVVNGVYAHAIFSLAYHPRVAARMGPL